MNIVGFLTIFFAATTWMPKIYGLNDRTTQIFFSTNTTLNNPGVYNVTGWNIFFIKWVLVIKLTGYNHAYKI